MVRTLRKATATFVTYALGYEIMAVALVFASFAALIGWHGFVRVGTNIWARYAFWLVGRSPRVHGRENMAEGRPYLVVANHSSMYDIPALMSAVPGVAIMGRDYLTRIPVFGHFLRSVHYIPIATDRSRSARAALDLAADRLRNGISVGIFPEGTRTTTGRLQPLKRGFITVLRRSGADLLPVYISGTYALQPKGKHTLDPSEPIVVRIGHPVANGELVSLDDDEIRQRVSATLERLGETRT